MTQEKDITKATPVGEEEPQSVVETVEVANPAEKKRIGKQEIQNTVLKLLAEGTPEAIAEAETLNKYFGVGNSIVDLLQKKIKKEGLTAENIEIIKKAL